MDEQPQELVAALARDVVQRVAPEEVSIFRATSRAYFASGQSRHGRGQDEMLGFGIEGAVLLLSPVVLEVCNRFLRVLADEAASTGEGLVKEILGKLKARLTKTQERPPAQFSQPELQHVREVTERTANDLRLPPEQVRLLADALVGSLVASSATAGSTG
jgi:hypothetical protein